MKEAVTNILFLCIGVVIALWYFRSCSPTKTTEKITHDTVTEVVHFPVVSGSGKGILKYTYSPRETLTIIEKDTICLHDTISQFTATLDTIQNKDTLHLEFSYPSAMFRYQLNRQADSVTVVYTTTTNTITIEPPKFSVGVQVGFGYLISWRTGQTAIGSYVGVGANYKL